MTASEELWDRRIAMMATYHYIRQQEFPDTLKIAALLRYAIEKFPEVRCKAYLNGKV
jgi:hypothetical protein